MFYNLRNGGHHYSLIFLPHSAGYLLRKGFPIIFFFFFYLILLIFIILIVLVYKYVMRGIEKFIEENCRCVNMTYECVEGKECRGFALEVYCFRIQIQNGLLQF